MHTLFSYLFVGVGGEHRSPIMHILFIDISSLAIALSIILSNELSSLVGTYNSTFMSCLIWWNIIMTTIVMIYIVKTIISDSFSFTDNDMPGWQVVNELMLSIPGMMVSFICCYAYALTLSLPFFILAIVVATLAYWYFVAGIRDYIECKHIK